LFLVTLLNPNVAIQDSLKIYLQAQMDRSNLPEDWKKPVHFNLALYDQVNDKMTIRRGIFHKCF